MGLRFFDVILDNPDGVVYGGQTVSGKVVVHLDDEKKMRNLSVRLKGRAKTGWSESRGSGKNRHTIHYHAEEEYFNLIVYLVGQDDGETEVLPAGEHEFPFQVTLPEGCPSSFEGGYGSIRYSAKAVIDRPWRFDHEAKVVFTVLEYQDLNLDPRAREPIEYTESKTLGALFWKSGELLATACLPQTGYVGGQNLGLKVVVKSTSHREIESVSAHVRQLVVFTAEHGWSTHCRREKERFAGAEYTEHVPGGGEEQVIDFSQLTLPPLPSMLLNCSIIDIHYDVVINLDPSGMHRDLEFKIPIIVGTIPLVLQQSYPEQPQPNPAGDFNPSAPPPDFNEAVGPSAPALYPDLPPPSYKECVFGRQNTTEEGDSEYSFGDKEFALKYLVYEKE